MIKENYDENKEEFCGACVVAPLAFAGVGVSAYGASSRGSNKKMKMVMLWGGLASILITLVIAYIYWTTCSECR